MQLNQDQNFIGVSTSLGENVFAVTGMHCDDSISIPFRYTLDLVSDNQAIKPEDLVGNPIDFWMILRDGSKQDLNGYVSQFSTGMLRKDGLRKYQVVVMPWFWLLTKTKNSVIFQNMNVKDIIQQVFSDYGFVDFKFSVSKTFMKRDYCVQYAESAFDFVSRLMEEEGLFYYFTHTKSKHTMEICDNGSNFTTCTENELIFLDNIADDHLHSWEHQHSFITGKVTGNNYTFLDPKTSLKREVSTVLKINNAKTYEHYEYPEPYVKTADADSFLKPRIEAEEAQYHTTNSSGTYRSLQVGGKFKITKHECESEVGKEYIITALRFEASEDISGNANENLRSYFNQFVCLPADKLPVPKQITPRSSIYGLQTAVVVGPSGEEIYTDEYGRIKIQFHWDRIGENNEKSSCWVRVAQTWTGKNWGSISIPRIGQEVVVSFLNGNPDQPLVTGCVYNAINMPPYKLPDNKTQSGLKTRSTKSGSTDTFNELRFEDKKDAEEVYFHAQKDLTSDINHNRTTTIKEGDDTFTLKKGNQSITLEEGNQTETLKKGNQSITLTKGNQSITLTEGSQTTELKKGDQSITLDNGKQTTLLKKGNCEFTLNEGDNKLTLDKGDLTTKLSNGSSSLEASKKIECKVGGNSSTIDTSKIELKVGGNSIKIEASGITLTCGSNSIKLDPSGATVKGMMVKVEGETMTEVKGSAMLKMQGGITMIN